MVLQFTRRYPASYSVTAIIAVGLLYFILAKIFLFLSLPGTNAAPIWPASGLALAATIHFGSMAAIGVFFGSLFANLIDLAGLFSNEPTFPILLVSLVTGLGAALQALVGEMLIRRFLQNGTFFNNGRNLLLFLFLGMLSALVNSTLGSTAIALAGFISWSLYPLTWLNWFAGDVGGVVVITPLILAWLKKPFPHLGLANIAEFFLFFLLILAIIFADNYFHSICLLYLYIPCILLAGKRFYLQGATALNFILILVIVLSTINIIGPFESANLNEALLMLELFIIVMTSTALAVTAEMHHSNR